MRQEQTPAGRRRVHRWRRAAIAWLALAAFSGGTGAQDGPDEQLVRAAMVFNFLKFTEFPPQPAASPQRLRLCFSVADAMQAEALQALAGRRVSGRELVVARIADRPDNCQVVYVDSRHRWTAATESGMAGNALTIGSYGGFTEEGGIMEIDVQASGNRFEINLAQARLARLRLSPQLLRLARRVHE